MKNDSVFAKIDNFLGGLSHEYIVVLAYSLSVLVIFALILIILYKGFKSKYQLRKLENLRVHEKG